MIQPHLCCMILQKPYPILNTLIIREVFYTIKIRLKIDSISEMLAAGQLSSLLDCIN